MKSEKSFLLNSHYFEDKRIATFRESFGILADTIFLRLLCRIYKQGSEIKYDGSLIQGISSELEIACATITTFVEMAVESGLFVRSKFEKGILRPSAEIAKAG